MAQIRIRVLLHVRSVGWLQQGVVLQDILLWPDPLRRRRLHRMQLLGLLRGCWMTRVQRDGNWYLQVLLVNLVRWQDLHLRPLSLGRVSLHVFGVEHLQHRMHRDIRYGQRRRFHAVLQVRLRWSWRHFAGLPYDNVAVRGDDLARGYRYAVGKAAGHFVTRLGNVIVVEVCQMSG